MGDFLEYALGSISRSLRLIFDNVFDTEESDKQKAAKEIVSKVYTIATNLMFVAIIVTLYIALLSDLGIFAFIRTPFQPEGSIPEAHFSFSAWFSGCIWLFVLIALSLAMLRGMLKLFRFLRASELTKLYAFVELIRLGVSYVTTGSTPVPWVMAALKAFFKG